MSRRPGRAEIIDAIARNLNLDACAEHLGMRRTTLQGHLERRGLSRDWVDGTVPLIIDHRTGASK